MADPTPAVQIRKYLATLPPAQRRVLKKLGDTLRAAAPGSVDAWSYKIPALRLDGRILLWYAAWAEHVSMYPVGPALLAAYKIDVKGRKTAKGTLQFPIDEPLPLALIKRVVKARIAQLRARAK